jgi:hypothetical protein
VTHGLRGYCILRESFHNLEKYRLNNLSFVFPTVPDGLLIARAYHGGELSSVSGEKINPSEGEFSVQVQGDADTNSLNFNFPKSISGEKFYYADYILIPIRPGTYDLGSFSVSANCYGRNLSKTSEAVSLKVHGCHMVVNKSIEITGDDRINVDVTVKNDGGRTTSIGLSDRTPPGCRTCPE